MATISLCMIARNEEHLIGQCLESVRALVSEIIVVDTGSTDNTKQIAQKFGARIIDRPWDNDFALPRNLGLQHASGDWILVLDADETIAKQDHSELARLTQNPRHCYEFMQRHYSSDARISGFTPVRGEYPEWEGQQPGYFESNCVRLFPNRCGLFFFGKVHELVEHSIHSLGLHTVVRTRVPIQHYGHTQAVKQRKQKSDIYTSLGQVKVREHPQDWKNHFELGVEHNCNLRYFEAVPEFIKALALNPQYVPTWVNLGYALTELGRYADAIEAFKTAQTLDPKDAEIYSNMGVAYLRGTQLVEAARNFLRAIELNPKYVVAHCNLGRTMWSMGDVTRAVECYERALIIMPQCTGASLDLGTILFACKQFEQSEKFLRRALANDASQSRAYYYLAQILKATARSWEALECFERFCSLEKKKTQTQIPSECSELLESAKQELENLKSEWGTLQS